MLGELLLGLPLHLFRCRHSVLGRLVGSWQLSYELLPAW